MPRPLLKLAFLITLVLAVTGLSARALGSTQPLNPALRGFTEGCEGKPQLCWYGIIVGETLIEDVFHILEQKGYSTTLISSRELGQFWRAAPSDANLCQVNLVTTFAWTDATQTKMIRYVERLILEDCPHMKLGDL